jgi:hypothetical protein
VCNITYIRLITVSVSASAITAVRYKVRVEVLHKAIRSIVDCSTYQAHVVSVQYTVCKPVCMHSSIVYSSDMLAAAVACNGCFVAVYLQ